MKQLVLELGQQNTIQLNFNIRSTPLAELWLERMQHRNKWTIDDPTRFYGLGTVAEETLRAENMIKQCMTVINSYKPIINREFEYTQDCLNYLHNIFEQYHGLLDQQTSEYWHSAPDTVKQALSNLNLAVHRCETAMAPSHPRFVCTWFGMPKTTQLDIDTMQEYGELEIKFGTVYLNYCEIGKPVEYLSHDNDIYIGDDAFKPFSHYSADFNVSLYDLDLNQKLPSMQHYIEQHQEFFLAHDIKNVYNVQALPLRFPVADLEYTGSRDELLSQIRPRQYVREVKIL